MLLFGLTWYIFTVITYGVSIPSGIFLPGIIMGQAMGRFYSKFLKINFKYDYSDDELL
jgi:H+/Cl- antiporter ClcA